MTAQQEREIAIRHTFDRCRLLENDLARLQAAYELAAKKNREHVKADDALRAKLEDLRAALDWIKIRSQMEGANPYAEKIVAVADEALQRLYA